MLGKRVDVKHSLDAKVLTLQAQSGCFSEKFLHRGGELNIDFLAVGGL